MVKNVRGGAIMPIKIDIKTNINEYELTLEQCSEIIGMLQDSYQNIRKDLYSQFLGKRSLKKAITVAIILFLLYFLTENIFFAYLVPVSVAIAMIASIASAEYISSKTRKIIQQQLQHYKETKERLLKEQKLTS